MLVELKHVEKHYKGFSLDCSLEVPEGRITGLIGANGAGKSTAFKAILGLIQTDGGEVKLFGQPVHNGEEKKTDAALKEQIGAVLSNSTFSGYLDIRQIVKIMDALYPCFDKEVFLERCRNYSLPVDKRLNDFSTGMKAKLKVFLALSYEAKLLILDEPTAGLDVIARDEILELLREYMEVDGRGILISSHISSDLEGLCDDLYMIDQGKVIMHEDTDVLLDTYAMIKADQEAYQKLDKKYLLRVKQEPYGYCCLTNQKSFYQENYPKLVMEKGSIDEMISMFVKGEEL